MSMKSETAINLRIDTLRATLKNALELGFPNELTSDNKIRLETLEWVLSEEEKL